MTMTCSDLLNTDTQCLSSHFISVPWCVALNEPGVHSICLSRTRNENPSHRRAHECNLGLCTEAGWQQDMSESSVCIAV